MKLLLEQASTEWQRLWPSIHALHPIMERVGTAMLECWRNGNKILSAGNGGSAADAMHLAEELSIRFQKTRKALAALALLDPTALTCAGNDFGFENIFSRQIEALGKAGDMLFVFSGSGNSPNILRAIEAARRCGVITIGMLGRDGGKARGLCDHELIIPATVTHRVQEGHQILYHTLCEWIDQRVD